MKPDLTIYQNQTPDTHRLLLAHHKEVTGLKSVDAIQGCDQLNITDKKDHFNFAVLTATIVVFSLKRAGVSALNKTCWEG